MTGLRTSGWATEGPQDHAYPPGSSWVGSDTAREQEWERFIQAIPHFLRKSRQFPQLLLSCPAELQVGLGRLTMPGGGTKGGWCQWVAFLPAPSLPHPGHWRAGFLTSLGLVYMCPPSAVRGWITPTISLNTWSQGISGSRPCLCLGGEGVPLLK